MEGCGPQCVSITNMSLMPSPIPFIGNGPFPINTNENTDTQILILGLEDVVPECVSTTTMSLPGPSYARMCVNVSICQRGHVYIVLH